MPPINPIEGISNKFIRIDVIEITTMIPKHARYFPVAKTICPKTILTQDIRKTLSDVLKRLTDSEYLTPNKWGISQGATANKITLKTTPKGTVQNKIFLILFQRSVDLKSQATNCG